MPLLIDDPARPVAGWFASNDHDRFPEQVRVPREKAAMKFQQEDEGEKTRDDEYRSEIHAKIYLYDIYTYI
jgi:hypothetical protein